MTENERKITELEDRITALVRTQVDFQKEISSLRVELQKMRAATSVEEKHDDVSFYAAYTPEAKTEQPAHQMPQEGPKSEVREKPPRVPEFGYSTSPPRNEAWAGATRDASGSFSQYAESARSDLERFIGENLISKVGIIVLIIGVGIGVKYSIDNDLISPLTRILLGYGFGFGLVGLAIKLKPNYLNFSAALLSGGMAIMYFVTYFAYSLYGLIPQTSAFALMVIFTIFTVAASVAYNRQVVAHIGLVGAYGVPFLLSSDSGNYVVLFSYMTLINLGILAVSVRKNWTLLFYTSFGFTWLIFFGWFGSRYSESTDVYPTLLFVAVFFAIFFAVSIVQRSFEEERKIADLVPPMLTGFVYYVACLCLVERGLATQETWVFLSLMTIVTAAILVASFKYFGRPPVYLSFILTWMVFAVWYGERHVQAENELVAPVFVLLIFLLFYGTVLGHRLITKELTLIENAGLILTNSFVFYGLGYSILARNGLESFQGLFTFANAGIHFGVWALVSKFRREAQDVLHIASILILTFLTITVPVQFDGNIVTMIWAVEGALLFWYGRRIAVHIFEFMAYPVLCLSVASMFFDWLTTYAGKTLEVSNANPIPLANGDLVTAMVLVAAFGFVYFINSIEDFVAAIPKDLIRPFGIAIAVIGTFIFYNAFRIEIANYYHLAAVSLNSSGVGFRDRAYEDLEVFNLIWQLIYTMAFAVGMAAVNLTKLRSKLVAASNCILGVGILFVFLTAGMFGFHELRESYLQIELGDPFKILIRYISYVFAAGLIYAFHPYRRSGLFSKELPDEIQRIGLELITTIVIFIVSSCELLNLMAQFQIADAGKLGLSILWGVFAVCLIAYGIAQNRKHMRIAAISLLAATLLKLFFYDAEDLDTIPKTILFVTVGLTLLVASFLYNKYKHLIFIDETERTEDSERR